MPPRKLARTTTTAGALCKPDYEHELVTERDVKDVFTQTISIPVAIRRYRVLFSDGDTVDFLSYSDHSGIRGDMLDLHFGKGRKKNPHGAESAEARIEGIADLGVVYVHTPALENLEKS